MMMQNMHNAKVPSKKPGVNILAKSTRAGNGSSMGMTSDFHNYDNFGPKIPGKSARRQINFTGSGRSSVNNTQINFYQGPKMQRQNLPNMSMNMNQKINGEQAISQSQLGVQNISGASRVSNASAMSHQMPNSIRYTDLINSYNDFSGQQNAAFKRFKEQNQVIKNGNQSSKG